MGFYYLEGREVSFLSGDSGETGHTFTCGAGTDTWAGSVHTWPSELRPECQASLCPWPRESHSPPGKQMLGAWLGGAHLWGVRSS